MPIMMIILVVAILLVSPVFPQGCTPETGLYVDVTSTETTPPYGCQTSPYPTLSQAIAYALSGSGGTIILAQQSFPQVFGLSSFVFSESVSIQGNKHILEIQGQVKINEGVVFHLSNASLQFNSNLTSPVITLVGSLDLEHVIVTGSTIQWGTITGALSFISCVISNTEKELMTASQFGVQLLITDSQFFNNSGIEATLLLFQPADLSSYSTVFNFQSTIFENGKKPAIVMNYVWEQFNGQSIPGEENNLITVANCTWIDFSSPALIISTWFISASFHNCVFKSNLLGIQVAQGASVLSITSSSFLGNTGAALSFPLLDDLEIANSGFTILIQSCIFQNNGQGFEMREGVVGISVLIKETVFQHNGTPGLSGGCLVVNAISVTLDTVDFDGCVGSIGPALYVKNSYVEMTNICMRNSHGSEGVGLYFVNTGAIVDSCIFEHLNSDGSIITAVASTDTFRNVTVRNCTATNDVLNGYISTWVTDQLDISNNTAGKQLISMVGSNWPLAVTNSSFSHNFASNVFVHSGGNPASFTNCVFTMVDPNTILFVNSAQMITLEACAFSGRFMILFRGMLPMYIFNMTDCVFQDAEVWLLFDGISYSGTMTNVLINNVTFTEGSSTSGFKINWTLSNVTLDGVRGEIFYLIKSNLYLENVVVSDYKTYLSPTEQFPMLEMWESNLVVTNFQLRNFTGLVSTSLFRFNENSVITFTDCSFSDLTQSAHSAGLISLSQSKLTFNNVFVDNWSVTLFTAKLSTIWLYNSTFTRGGTGSIQLASPDFDGGLINGLDVVTFWMENCSVETIGARSGGVIYLTYDVPTQPMFRNVNDLNTFAVILNSTFQNSTVTVDGGMIYISDGSASLHNSTFLNSSAGRNGGFFNFLCNSVATDYNCTYDLINLSLTHSSAGQDGGAIKYNRTQPILTNVQSADTTAVYGPFLAGYPVQLGFVNVSDLNFSQDFNLHRANESSGEAMDTLVYLGLYDLTGKLVRTNNFSTMNILMSSFTNSSALLTGLLSYTFKGGLCLLNQTITVTGVPGSTVILNFYSNAIDYNDPDPNTGFTPSSTNLTYTLRNCTKGEIIKDNKCYECPQGTYSFSTANAFFCKPCLIGMNCYGGANSAIQSGYWSPSVESEEIYVCPQSSTCSGGNGTECATGYSSRLCSVCIDGWFAYGRGLCTKCASKGVQIIRGAVILLVVLLFLVFIIYLSIAAAKKKKPSSLGTQLRIFLSYVQIMMMMNHFSIEWPVTLSSYFDALYTSGNAPLMAFSIECFYSQEGVALQFVYAKLIIISILPVFVMVLSSIIWSIVSAAKWNIMFLTQHNICSICVILITLHPLILLSVLKLLSCTPMEQGTFWLIADTNIQCWVGEHNKYVLIMVIPVVIIWCIGIPVIFYLYFLINRKKLKEEVVMRRLAFLYIGYNEDSYYWEFVNMAKKSFFVLVANVLSASNGSLQCYAGLLGLGFFSFLHIVKQPYKTFYLNTLMTHSLLASATTLMCGLMVDTVLGQTDSLYYLLLVLIYSANVNYILRSILDIIRSARERLVNSFPRLWRCLCFKRKSNYIPAQAPEIQLSLEMSPITGLV